MFRKRIKKAEDGVTRCELRLSKVAKHYPSEIPYWRGRVFAYEAALEGLKELQCQYDKKRGIWRRLLHLHTNGTDRIGLELMARSRLEVIKETLSPNLCDGSKPSDVF